jgi:hypothetical protein
MYTFRIGIILAESVLAAYPAAATARVKSTTNTFNLNVFFLTMVLPPWDFRYSMITS